MLRKQESWEKDTCSFERIGVMDRFGESGNPEALLKKYGLLRSHIVNEQKK